LAAFGIATVGLTARYLPITNHVTLMAAVASPYLMLGGPVAFILLALIKHWFMAFTGACLVVVCTAVQLPLYVGSGQSESESTAVRVVSANLRLGLADADTLVSLARSSADVLAVQELTFSAVERLSRAGLDAAFPYRALQPHDYASGAGLWSRYPIHSVNLDGDFQMVFMSARIHVSGVGVDPSVVVAHMSGPWPQPITDWREDLELFPSAVSDVARRARGGALIVAADFNSTMDVRPFRRLLRNGYHDAAEQAGAGMTRTYPADSMVPPLLAIDHVVTRLCTATSVWTATLPGSDHRALVATVQIPRGS
jgi:endonuclease/exonuclease/phosphatase (EEP) superfamily protein YafD